MTNEENAKAYEMALEAARKELGVDRKEWEVVQQVLCNIFPELAESEDEWVPKELIEYLKQKSDYRSCWIAWLEKQKEQKPADYNEYKMLIDGAREDGKIKGRKEVIDHPEKYDLQKPAEWSEEDKKMYKMLSSMIHGTFIVETQETQDKLLSWLKSLTLNLKKKNEDITKLCSNELSEEDEGELQNAIDALEFLGKKGVYKSESGYDAALQAASWLKNIPERFNLKSKH